MFECARLATGPSALVGVCERGWMDEVCIAGSSWAMSDSEIWRHGLIDNICPFTSTGIVAVRCRTSIMVGMSSRREVSSSFHCFMLVYGGIQPCCMFASDEIHGSTISKLFAELVERAKEKKRERKVLKWSEILKVQDNGGIIRT
jgi:hypothetical protein